MTSESLLEYFAHNKLSEKVKMLNEITKFESILKNSLEQHESQFSVAAQSMMEIKLRLFYLLVKNLDRTWP